jgi:DNA-binding MarR family transcriptional regulator
MEVMAKPRPSKRLPATELDPEQLRVWFAYMRVNLQLTYEMNHQLLAESELSLSDYHVLSKLHQAPDQRLRIAPLAREIGWERSRASHQVRRMAQRGLIATEAVRNDRRGTEVTVTDSGKAAFRDARQGHVALVRELFFRGLSEDVLLPLAETLEHVYTNIVEHGSGYRGADD